jgi:CelD/BcsL family acetyltransferase involved in cellulose biosynthesis
MLTLDRVDETGFAQLSEEWDAALRASAADSFFLTFDWLHTWWRHFGSGRRLFLLTVRRGVELVAVAPFAIAPPRLDRLVPFRSLEFLGAGSAGSDYLDVFARPECEAEVARILGDHLARHSFMLQLGRVRPGVSLASRVAAALEGQGWTHRETPHEVCPFIPLGGHTWESYLSGLGSAHRYNVQRRLRNLYRRYAVELHRVATEEERGPALARLFQLHDARWRPRGGSDGFGSENELAFHDEVTRRALAGGRLRLFELRLDGRPAASLYGFRHGGTFSFYQSGFDPAFTKDSVGLVMMSLAIQSAIEEGAVEYDFLHGDEAYKFQWARDARPLARLEIFPPRLRGLLCQQAVALGRVARRTARRILPEPMTGRRTAGLRAATSRAS